MAFPPPWLALLLVLVAPAFALTGGSGTTCLAPIGDARIETIENPTPVAGEIYGLRMAGRGRVLALCEYLPMGDDGDTIEIYVRDSILDTFGAPAQTLSVAGVGSQTTQNDLCRAVALSDRWLVSGGEEALYIFEYIPGTGKFTHIQTVATSDTATTVGVSCDRIVYGSSSEKKIYQLWFNDGMGLFESFPGQEKINTKGTPVSVIFNDNLNELYIGTSTHLMIASFASCSEEMDIEQKIKISSSVYQVDVDADHRIVVALYAIGEVRLYARSSGGVYTLEATITEPSASGFALSASFAGGPDGGLVVGAPYESIDSTRVGQIYTYDKQGSSYVFNRVYDADPPTGVTTTTNNGYLGYTATTTRASINGDYAIVSEPLWVSDTDGREGRVHTLCLSDEYCCGTCGSGCDLDNNPCTVDECVEGYYLNSTHTTASCEATKAQVDVDDGNPCTLDSCDPYLGIIHAPLNVGECILPTDPCWIGICRGGACIDRTRGACDDNDACTTDTCGSDGTCFYAPTKKCTTETVEDDDDDDAGSTSTATRTPTRTPSVSPSTSVSSSVSRTPSLSQSSSRSPTSSSSVSGSPTSSASRSESSTKSLSVSRTPTSSPSESSTSSTSASASTSPSPTISDSTTSTTSQSGSLTSSVSRSATSSPTSSVSATPSVTPSVSMTNSATRSTTSGSTPSTTPSNSPSISDSSTSTSSATATSSTSTTASVSESSSTTSTTSQSATASVTASTSFTATPSPSSTNTASATATVSDSSTTTVSQSASVTASASTSNTASATASISDSTTTTASQTASVSLSSSPSLTATSSRSESATASRTISVTATPSISVTASPSATASVSDSPTPSLSLGMSPSNTPSNTPSSSFSSSISISASPSPSPSNYAVDCVANPTSISPCDDGIACTVADHCDGAGNCVGQPVASLCPMGDECQKPVCDVAFGGCTLNDTAYDGYACGSANATACVFEFTCDSGACTPLVNITDADCDDNNECTVDSCDPASGCVHDGAPQAGTTCTPVGSVEVSFCYQDAVCDGLGGCEADINGTVTDCDDAIACTVDYCDSINGCTHWANHTACESDGNDCTEAVCSTSQGCIHVAIADGLDCSDGYYCTVNDACIAGTCVGEEESSFCDDIDSCNLRVCDIDAFSNSTGSGCIEVDAPNGTPCPDLGNECLRNGTCLLGNCTNFTELDCNDYNSCTDQVCDPVMGCVYTPVAAGLPCAYATAAGICMLSGQCTVNGTCFINPYGPQLSCDDGLTCTVDRCDLDTGCFHEANHTACEHLDTGNQCSEYRCDPTSASSPGDGCVEMAKAAGTYCVEAGESCSNNGQCDGDSHCITIPQSGLCPTDPERPCESVECVAELDGNGDTDTYCATTNVTAGVACLSPDATMCSKNYECDGGGECLPTLVVTDGDCEDDNPCTESVCDPVTGCMHNVLPPDTPCGSISPNTDLCFTDGICNNYGACMANVTGPQVPCNDNVTCTFDRCDSVDGCTYEARDSLCPDETGNQCTVYRCNATAGCLVEDVADGTGCIDGSPCTTDDRCVAGVCIGVPVDSRCPDDGPCREGVCQLTIVGNVTRGTCGYVDTANGTACGVPDQCNMDLECDGLGACVAQTVIEDADCDEGNPCAAGSCDPYKGCVYEYASLDGVSCGVQVINDNGTCFLNNTCDGLGSCQPDASASTIDCSDDVMCTQDLCDGTGQCQHIPLNSNCPANPSPCSYYECSLVSGCQLKHVINGTGCSDGHACTTDDHCESGICVGTAQDVLCPNNSECHVKLCVPQNSLADAEGCINAFTIDVPCPSFDTECLVDGTCNGYGECVNHTDIGLAKCEDYNSCTTDTCNGIFGCFHTPVTSGTPCMRVDGGLCFESAICSANGTCEVDVSGPVTNCDDSIACTVDTCSLVDGCVYHPIDGLCNHVDTGAACTIYECQLGNGCVEVALPDGTECHEMDGVCSLDGQCSAGQCIVLPRDDLCPSHDTNACLEPVCSAYLGVNGTVTSCGFQNRTVGSLCASVNETECSRDYRCDGGGQCLSTTTVLDSMCAAFNPCTVEYCDPDLGCVSENLPPATPCGLMNVTTSVCFLDSLCDGIGNCIPNLSGAQENCTDGIECTVDGCDSVEGCTYVPDSSLCQDSANPCTETLCMEGIGCTEVDRADNHPCPAPDNNQCAHNHRCVAGVCTADASDELCPDPDACNYGICTTALTGDGYTLNGTCTTTFVANGTECAVGDECSRDFRCDGVGTCAATTVILNSDCEAAMTILAPECSTVICRPSYGCILCPENSGETCDDIEFHTSVCYLDMVCNNYAQCVEDIFGEQLECNDHIVCTRDTCDDVLGCLNEPDDSLCAQPTFGCYESICRPSETSDVTGCVLRELFNGTRCDDAVDCTTDDRCLGGVCVGVEQDRLCGGDVNDDCLVGACLAVDRTANFEHYVTYWNHSAPQHFSMPRVNGCDFQKAENGAQCHSAEDQCSLHAQCQAGVCEATVLVTDEMCDDHNDCTADTCDPVLGCIHVPTNIGGPCATMAGPDSSCMLNSTCTSGGYCLPTHVGDSLDCPTPSHSCLRPTCSLASGCVEEAADSLCPTTGTSPCTQWRCDPSEAPTTSHGCVLKAREVGSFCKHERPCVMESFCDGEGVCSGIEVHSMCERDFLHCSVDMCVSDLADVEGVDELGCRQTLLEGECRHWDPCVISEAPDFITTCNAETFECEGGRRMDCPHGGHSFAACFGGVCESESISVSDDDVDDFEHFEEWWFLFMIMIILMIGICLVGCYAYADIRHRLSRDPTSPDYSEWNGAAVQEPSGFVDPEDAPATFGAGPVKRVGRSSKLAGGKQKKRKRRSKAAAADYRAFPGAYTRVPERASSGLSTFTWRKT